MNSALKGIPFAEYIRKQVVHRFVSIPPACLSCMQMTDQPEVASRRSAPHFAAFTRDDDGEECQYFVFVEGQVLCYTTSFSKALMLWFALHYILNLEYSKEVRDASLFLQEFVYSLPASSAAKRTKGGSYLFITTDIHKFCP